MITISTEEALFDWLFVRILEAEPIIEVSPGLVRIAKAIHREVHDIGYLARYAQDCWYATFHDIFRYVSAPGKVRCSAKVIDWLAAVYARTAAAVDPQEALSLASINHIGIGVLGMEGTYLTVSDDGATAQIRSTGRALLELYVRICVTSSLDNDIDC